MQRMHAWCEGGGDTAFWVIVLMKYLKYMAYLETSVGSDKSKVTATNNQQIATNNRLTVIDDLIATINNI